MRIGIIAVLHESNTFVQQTTTLDRFREDLFLHGDAVRQTLSGSHHEIGGFFAGLDKFGGCDVTAVPLIALRATPSGVLTSATFESISDLMFASLESAGELDGLLIAVHGAAVSEEHRDADGEWLCRIRSHVGKDVPIVATLDLHANLSMRIAESCDALIAYRTNPHLDQQARGCEAAELMMATLRNQVRPTMAAAFPPMLISIQHQCTEDAPLRAIYQAADRQRSRPGVLSNSVLLGFPYADVREMGASTVVVTHDDPELAQQLATDLAGCLWQTREEMHGSLVEVDAALDLVAAGSDRVCLLDMGDNVGGGSAADGTILVRALVQRSIGPSVAVVYDPAVVAACEQAGQGARIQMPLGGKTDDLHGEPIDVDVTVRSFHDGRFREDQPRHGGIVEFDQGPTVVVQTTDGLMTLIITSRRMAPFSLGQLTSCGINPNEFRVLVAKGVNAPIAAYQTVCDRFIRVNTLGSTCADVTRLAYAHRRNPLYPLEPDASF